MWPLYDRALGGRLRQVISRYREQGMGCRKIADRLALDHDLHPSYRTVARWLADPERASGSPLPSSLPDPGRPSQDGCSGGSDGRSGSDTLEVVPDGTGLPDGDPGLPAIAS